ncbi:MAG: hypothetical protein ACM3XM_07960 [Mycobacterium leprae]
MQYLEFEFETEKELRDTVKKLWDGLNVSGEMVVRPMANGRWRLEVIAEKELRDSTLEKFSSFRIQAEEE